MVPELIADFRPQVLVTQHGADTHFEDPLAHLAVSLDAQRAVQVACHDLAHEYADGRWVALGGGGYAVVEVVPRSWTHLVAIAAGAPVDPETDDPGGVAARGVRAHAAAGAGADDGRAVAGRWRRLGGGVRPGGPAGPGGAGDPAGGVPAAGAAGLSPPAGLCPPTAGAMARYLGSEPARGRRSGARDAVGRSACVSTGALRAHLLAARLAGPVATSREESLRSYRLFAARDPRVLLGLDPEWAWGERD